MALRITIVLQSLCKLLPHHGLELARLEHPHLGAIAKDFRHKVGTDTHPVIENTVAVVHNLLLAVVQRKVAEIPRLAAFNLQGNALNLAMGEHYAETRAEIFTL